MDKPLDSNELENIARHFLSHREGSKFEIFHLPDNRVKIQYGLGGGVCSEQEWKEAVLKQLNKGE